MYQIQACEEEDKRYIVDRLVAYNLTQVPARQEELFVDLSRKAVAESGEVIAGIIAGTVRMWMCCGLPIAAGAMGSERDCFGRRKRPTGRRGRI